jgi:hypothetical protein
MARGKPTVTRTFAPIHFEDLDPHRFEDLIRELIYDFRDWRNIEATGRAGSDDGFDIRAFERLPQQEQPEDQEEPRPGAVSGLDKVKGRGSWSGGSGGPSLDDIGTDFILGDVFEAHVGMGMLSQPAFGRAAAFRKMKQFHSASMLLEDAHGTDGRSFDDLKSEIVFDGMRTQNCHQHDTSAGEITLVEGDPGGRCIGWLIALRLLPDQARDAITTLPRGELLVEARGRSRRAVGISDE